MQGHVDDGGFTPCKGCEHFKRCEAKRLACAVFTYWEKTGKVRHWARVPSRAEYNRRPNDTAELDIDRPRPKRKKPAQNPDIVRRRESLRQEFTAGDTIRTRAQRSEVVRVLACRHNLTRTRVNQILRGATERPPNPKRKKKKYHNRRWRESIRQEFGARDTGTRAQRSMAVHDLARQHNLTRTRVNQILRGTADKQ
jgi:hypothetical protein